MRQYNEKIKKEWQDNRLRKIRKSSIRHCKKSKTGYHDWLLIFFPNARYPHLSSQWKKGWCVTNKEESAWFLAQCSICNKQEIILARNNKAKP
jgi:hypothetical protein